jgi:predicted nucleotidyltransferase
MFPPVMERHLLEALRAAAAGAFRGQPVLVAYAFGSRISGRPRPSSDLDVGYYLRGYPRGDTFPFAEELHLADELSRAAGLEVDLRDLAAASLELKGRVLEEGIRIFSADEPRRVALEREILGRYHDYKEEFRRMHDMRLRRVASLGLSPW